MGDGAILKNVGYKTMLRAEQAENFCVYTLTCDILGVY